MVTRHVANGKAFGVADELSCAFERPAVLAALRYM
jgi:hypothetical protein